MTDPKMPEKAEQGSILETTGATAPANDNPAPNKVIPIEDVAKHAEEVNKPFMVPASAVRTPFFDPIVWEQMKGMATTFEKSGAFPPGDNAAKLMVKLQAGREMGMSPIESIKSFYFVSGQINIFGAAIMRRLREHGWMITYKDEVNKCTATIRNNKGEEYSDSLTFDEAEASGWTSGSQGIKPGWKEGINRKLKLRYGVTSMLIKTYVPEVMGSAVDIAEVAMDAAPVYEAYKDQVAEIDGGSEPATEGQLATIKTLGGVLPDEPLTKQGAAQTIKELTTKKAKGTK